MVVYCSVCMNNTRKTRNKCISYFNFPKDSNRRESWLKVIGREDLILKLDNIKTRQQYRVCEEHFETQCIKLARTGSIKYLHDYAFPTLNLPSYEGEIPDLIKQNAFPPPKLPSNEGESSDLIQENDYRTVDVPVEYVMVPQNQDTTSNSIVYEDLTSINIKTEPVEDIISHSINTGPDEYLPSHCIKIERNDEDLTLPIINTESDMENCTAQINGLSADIPRKRKLVPALRKAKKKQKCNLDDVTKEDFFKLCDKFMTKSMSQMIKWQIDTKAGYRQNGHSLAFKFFALNLYYSGPAAYRFLTNSFCLPSLVTLQKLVMPRGTQIDKRLLTALKAKVNKMGSHEKICSVCVNYMPLKGNLYYDIRNDRIIGLHEINGIQKKDLAKYGIVIMIRGIIHNWKQPIVYSFMSQSKTHTELNESIDDIIVVLLNIGLDIRLFVSNLGSDFIKASNLRHVSSDKTYFEANGHKIYYMFNVPHLMKCVRSNFKTCNFIFDSKVAQWSHIEDMYNQDKNQQIRLAPKLTDIHINSNNIENMRLNLATEVLSRTVASAINKYIDLNLIDPAARDTAVFIKKVNDLFDILNSNTLRSRNKFKRAFCGASYQIEFLQEMLSFFKNLNTMKILGQKDYTNVMNIFKGFQVTIKSVLQLSKDLKSEGITYILTRRLNQDFVENFFGKVRQVAGNGREPTCKQFGNTFKKTFVTNILKQPQNSNLDSLQKPEDCSDVSLDLQLEEINTPVLTVGTTDYRFDLPEKDVLLHVSCYLFRKCLEKHNCKKLKLFVKKSKIKNIGNDLNEGNDIPPNNFIAFIKLLELKFREYFDLEKNNVNTGNEIFMCIKHCKFDTPCECFPLDYLKKLYIRFRIYHSIKTNKELLKNKNNIKFTVNINPFTAFLESNDITHHD